MRKARLSQLDSVLEEQTNRSNLYINPKINVGNRIPEKKVTVKRKPNITLDETAVDVKKESQFINETLLNASDQYIKMRYHAYQRQSHTQKRSNVFARLEQQKLQHGKELRLKRLSDDYSQTQSASSSTPIKFRLSQSSLKGR